MSYNLSVVNLHTFGSYSGQVPENTSQQQSLKDKQRVADNVAVNKNRVLHDTSKRGGGIY